MHQQHAARLDAEPRELLGHLTRVDRRAEPGHRGRRNVRQGRLDVEGVAGDLPLDSIS
ncbi:MAG: hypothetical protein SFV24_25165 [Gemmatimonadales bacterium]|nr:hypothetical protein [Gemmatimonadales bacterium]